MKDFFSSFIFFNIKTTVALLGNHAKVCNDKEYSE